MMRLLAVLGCLLAYTTTAQAKLREPPPIQVEPKKIKLTPGQTSQILEVTNREKATVVMQIEVYAWSNGLNGELLLAPTEDVVAFPQVVQMAPGETRTVRVGAKSPSESVQRGYRVVLQQLSAIREAAKPKGVTVLTSISLPIFSGIEDAAPMVQVRKLKERSQQITAVVSNNGKGYTSIYRVGVEAVSDTGTVLFNDAVEGWYLLSGESRLFTFKPPPMCGSKYKVKLSIRTADGPVTHSQRAKGLPCPEGVAPVGASANVVAATVEGGGSAGTETKSPPPSADKEPRL